MKLAIALIAFAIVSWFIFGSSIYSHRCSQKRKGRGGSQ